MIYSTIITILILGIAIIFGLTRNERLAELQSEWETLKKQGAAYEIPEDPEAAYAPTRLGSRSEKKVRTAEIDAFSIELIAFMKEVKEAERNGNSGGLELQKRGMELFSQMADFSASEVKLLVENITADASLKDKTKSEMVMMSVMLLSQEEPRTALAIIIETKGKILKKNQMTDHFIGIAIGQLAAKEPMAAVQWMKDHKEDIGGISDDLRSQVLARAAQEDLKASFGLINDLEFKEPSNALSSIARSVTAENATDYLEGIRALDSDQKEHALQTLGNSEFWENFDQATEWIEDTEFQADEKNSLIKGLNYNTIKDDPAQWLDWLGLQEEVASTSGVSRKIINNWTRNDFKATGEWVNSLDDGPQREAAVYNYAKTLNQHEPQAALAWAKTLQEGVQKAKLMKLINDRRKDQGN